MSGYGFGECKLCGAVDDYCTLQPARGLTFDCRFLVDDLTDAQIANLKELVTPAWWVREQGLQALKELAEEAGELDV